MSVDAIEEVTMKGGEEDGPAVKGAEENLVKDTNNGGEDMDTLKRIRVEHGVGTDVEEEVSITYTRP